MSIQLNEQGARIYFQGNTFPLKDKIKSLGGHWDADARAWWIGKAKKADAEALLNGAAQSQVNVQADGLSEDTRVLGRADYKGKSYLLIAFSQDQTRALLAFSDGSRKWSADVAEVNVTKRYEPMTRSFRGRESVTYQTIGSLKRYAERMKLESSPEYRAKAETRRCWECGRDFQESDARSNGGDWKDSYCGC